MRESPKCPTAYVAEPHFQENDPPPSPQLIAGMPHRGMVPCSSGMEDLRLETEELCQLFSKYPQDKYPFGGRKASGGSAGGNRTPSGNRRGSGRSPNSLEQKAKMRHISRTIFRDEKAPWLIHEPLAYSPDEPSPSQGLKGHTINIRPQYPRVNVVATNKSKQPSNYASMEFISSDPVPEEIKLLRQLSDELHDQMEMRANRVEDKRYVEEQRHADATGTDFPGHPCPEYFVEILSEKVKRLDLGLEEQSSCSSMGSQVEGISDGNGVSCWKSEDAERTSCLDQVPGGHHQRPSARHTNECQHYPRPSGVMIERDSNKHNILNFDHTVIAGHSAQNRCVPDCSPESPSRSPSLIGRAGDGYASYRQSHGHMNVVDEFDTAVQRMRILRNTQSSIKTPAPIVDHYKGSDLLIQFRYPMFTSPAPKGDNLKHEMNVSRAFNKLPATMESVADATSNSSRTDTWDTDAFLKMDYSSKTTSFSMDFFGASSRDNYHLQYLNPAKIGHRFEGTQSDLAKLMTWEKGKFAEEEKQEHSDVKGADYKLGNVYEPAHNAPVTPVKRNSITTVEEIGTPTSLRSIAQQNSSLTLSIKSNISYDFDSLSLETLVAHDEDSMPNLTRCHASRITFDGTAGGIESPEKSDKHRGFGIYQNQSPLRTRGSVRFDLPSDSFSPLRKASLECVRGTPESSPARNIFKEAFMDSPITRPLRKDSSMGSLKVTPDRSPKVKEYFDVFHSPRSIKSLPIGSEDGSPSTHGSIRGSLRKLRTKISGSLGRTERSRQPSVMHLSKAPRGIEFEENLAQGASGECGSS